MKKSPSSEDLVAIPGRVERNKEYARGSAGPSERDHVRFPEVERTTGKRKLAGLAAFEMRASPTMDPDRINLRNGKRRNVKVLDDEAARNSSKEARRNAEIDVLDSAKRRRSVTGSQTASSAKFPGVKLNLSLSIRSPQLDVGRVFQCSRGNESQFTKAGSIAEFKRDVLKERERKRRMNVRMRDIFDAEKIQAMSRRVSEIDFDRLKIGGDSHDERSEVSFVRNMSSMTLFDGNYREPKSDCGTADDDGEINYARPEMPKRKVAGRLKNFLIQKDRDAGSLLEESSQIKSEATDFVDSDMATKAHCLKICDETGETVGEFEGNCRRVEYCTNDLTTSLNAVAEGFFAGVYRLRRRMYGNDKVKVRTRWRSQSGFEEVLEHVESRKIRFVAIAPDLVGSCDCPGASRRGSKRVDAREGSFSDSIPGLEGIRAACRGPF
ncbi:uncharacterized protein LOC105693307 [Athalia rosae]|uniref:uncharacterized protein LOC105693307 n=1 Tax=Athalia rosae TaxID=37344 RepID=UPI0020332DCE|nr:uncharacterized protein LOC105693307 [Athalia rosae]